MLLVRLAAVRYVYIAAAGGQDVRDGVGAEILFRSKPDAMYKLPGAALVDKDFFISIKNLFVLIPIQFVGVQRVSFYVKNNNTVPQVNHPLRLEVAPVFCK